MLVRFQTGAPNQGGARLDERRFREPEVAGAVPATLTKDVGGDLGSRWSPKPASGVRFLGLLPRDGRRSLVLARLTQKRQRESSLITDERTARWQTASRTSARRWSSGGTTTARLPLKRSWRRARPVSVKGRFDSGGRLSFTPLAPDGTGTGLLSRSVSVRSRPAAHRAPSVAGDAPIPWELTAGTL